jgi:hypothetical protein
MEKKSKLSRFYFWLFILSALMAAFLFWSAKNDTEENKDVGTNLVAAIIATLVSLLLGIICFVRFIRSRSIAGGLFMTTAISTGVFLGASQIIAAAVPANATVLSAGSEASGSGITTIVGLAQIGLFALWFLFLLLTIYVMVSPIKKIDKALQRILDGEDMHKVNIGKAKQFRDIEDKLGIISKSATARRKAEERAEQERTKLAEEEHRRKEQRKEMLRKRRKAQKKKNVAEFEIF